MTAEDLQASDLPPFTGNQVQADLGHIAPKPLPTPPAVREKQLQELALFVLRLQLLDLLSLSKAQVCSTLPFAPLE